MRRLCSRCVIIGTHAHSRMNWDLMKLCLSFYILKKRVGRRTRKQKVFSFICSVSTLFVWNTWPVWQCLEKKRVVWFTNLFQAFVGLLRAIPSYSSTCSRDACLKKKKKFCPSPVNDCCMSAATVTSFPRNFCLQKKSKDRGRMTSSFSHPVPSTHLMSGGRKQRWFTFKSQETSTASSIETTGSFGRSEKNDTRALKTWDWDC